MDFFTGARPLVLSAGIVLFFGLYIRSAFCDPLTLDHAWAMAESNNPALRSAQAKLAAAHGEQAEGRALLFNNPQLSAAAGPRRKQDGAGESGTTNDWTVALSQTFEVAGQRSARREAVDHALEAVRQDIEEARRQLRAEVERRFVEVLSLQTRLDLGQQSVTLIENTAQIVRRRVAAGEDSKLDGNLASVEAERARNELSALQEQLVQARATLFALLQTPARDSLEVVGSLEPRPISYRLDQLLTAASQRAGVQALQVKERAARSRLDLEKAARYPDITLGVSQYKEGTLVGKDLITLFSVSIPLPVFKRNDAGIGRATTELTQASVERAAGELNARADVSAFWERREKLRTRVTRLQEAVLPTLEENMKLSQKSLASGAIGLPAWILAQRQVLDGQRDLVEARTALRLVQVDLEAAAGVGSGSDGSR